MKTWEELRAQGLGIKCSRGEKSVYYQGKWWFITADNIQVVNYDGYPDNDKGVMLFEYHPTKEDYKRIERHLNPPKPLLVRDYWHIYGTQELEDGLNNILEQNPDYGIKLLEKTGVRRSHTEYRIILELKEER